MERVPMTVEGHKRLEEELHRLKSVERPRIIQASAEARAHGDLSENAEYHSAKEQQGLNEARVAEAHRDLIEINATTYQTLVGKVLGSFSRLAADDSTVAARDMLWRRA